MIMFPKLIQSIFPSYHHNRVIDKRNESKSPSNKMTHKLEEIESDIKEAYKTCQSNGLTDEEIECAFNQVFNENELVKLLLPSRWNSLKHILIRMIQTMIAISLVILSIIYIDPFYHRACMYGRLVLFQIKPYWDWSDWYTSSCLIDNPYYVSKSLRYLDCHFCEDVSIIERRDDITSELLSEQYIRNHVPIIIDSNMAKTHIDSWIFGQDWFNLSYLEKMYESNESEEKNKNWDSEDDGVCMFQSNIKSINHMSLLRKVMYSSRSASSGKSIELKWYAHWENCIKRTEKKLRRYYSTPHFLPPMIELTRSNWILISYQYNGKTYKLIDPSPGTQLMMMAQIRGSNHIKLDPKGECISLGCDSLYETLQEGDIFLFSTKLWNFSYLPAKQSQYNFAIIIGGVYD